MERIDWTCACHYHIYWLQYHTEIDQWVHRQVWQARF